MKRWKCQNAPCDWGIVSFWYLAIGLLQPSASLIEAFPLLRRPTLVHISDRRLYFCSPPYQKPEAIQL